MPRFENFENYLIYLLTLNNLISILDLNQMEVRPPRQIVKIEENPLSGKYLVKQEESVADNILVVGERYQPDDVRAMSSLHLGRFTSGVAGE